MNEADSPHQPTVPVPIEPAVMAAFPESIAPEVLNPASDDGWQTVDFPGAMSVDAIPDRQMEGLGEASQGIIHYSGTEISPAATYTAAIPFEPSREHLQQLLQELERSHQTAQRQQILVETLTVQLSSSQERIAQLERDCALTQQRHNEQVQRVLQAENACRDLRLRLHRQQQQTIQFKAALEKSLEMPTAYGHTVIPDVALTGATLPEAMPALPKNSPVKPWSLAEGALDESALVLPRPLFKLLNHGSAQEHDSEAFATPFSEPDGETLPAFAVQPALLDSTDPQFVTHLMQLVLPTAELVSSVAANVLQSVPMLDLSPSETELEPEGADTDALPTIDVPGSIAMVSPDRPSGAALDDAGQQHAVSSSPDAIVAASILLPDDHATDPLWDDLATLIDPPRSAERVSAAVAAVDRPDELLDPAHTDMAASGAAGLVPLDRPLPDAPPIRAMPPIFAAVGAAASPLQSAATQTPMAWTWRDRLVSAGKVARSIGTEQAAQPLPPLAQSAASQPVQQPVSGYTSLTTTTVLAIPPSPIVYPLRPTRKLASLAAVNLPTFPKP